MGNDQLKFKLVCPKCNEQADVMSYRRTGENLLRAFYICPYCGHGDIEFHYMYE